MARKQPGAPENLPEGIPAPGAARRTVPDGGEAEGVLQVERKTSGD